MRKWASYPEGLSRVPKGTTSEGVLDWSSKLGREVREEWQLAVANISPKRVHEGMSHGLVVTAEAQVS